MVVHTVGHSTRTADELLAILQAAGVRGVADVRRFPGSRRHPQFVRETLAARLALDGLAYDWLPALGGRRTARKDSPHTGWRVAAFRAYADHMESPEFAEGLEQLLALAAARPTAIMCAEAVPWRCHRQLLADALVARGVTVLHLLGTRADRHRLTAFARRDGTRLVYDGGQPALV